MLFYWIKNDKGITSHGIGIPINHIGMPYIEEEDLPIIYVISFNTLLNAWKHIYVERFRDYFLFNTTRVTTRDQ